MSSSEFIRINPIEYKKIQRIKKRAEKNLNRRVTFGEVMRAVMKATNDKETVDAICNS